MLGATCKPFPCRPRARRRSPDRVDASDAAYRTPGLVVVQNRGVVKGTRPELVNRQAFFHDSMRWPRRFCSLAVPSWGPAAGQVLVGRVSRPVHHPQARPVLSAGSGRSVHRSRSEILFCTRRCSISPAARSAGCEGLKSPCQENHAASFVVELKPSSAQAAQRRLPNRTDPCATLAKRAPELGLQRSNQACSAPIRRDRSHQA